MNDALRTLRWGIGSVMVVFGATQIIRPGGWLRYVPRTVSRLLPVPETTFMRSHGGVNVGLGILFMSGWRPVFISYATLAWWLSILPFAFYDDWHSGMRDYAIILAIIAVIVLLHSVPTGNE